MDNIINFDSIEEKTSKELTQGFRSCYSITINQIAQIYKRFIIISGATDSKTYAHKLIVGARKTEIAKMCHDLEVWGNHLVKLSKSMTTEYLECLPEEIDEKESDKHWLHEVLMEQFNRRRSIVDEMLDEYSKRMFIEMENDLRSQFYNGRKHQNEVLNEDSSKQQ